MRRLALVTGMAAALILGVSSCEMGDITEDTQRQAACLAVSAFDSAGETSSDATRMGLNAAADFLQENSPENSQIIGALRDMTTSSNELSREAKIRISQEAKTAMECS